MTSSLQERVEALISGTVEAMGYEVVRIALTGGKSRGVLQVMIEPSEDRMLTVDDCVAVSRSVSALLDETDPIGGTYSLEVTSPGIDRPLTREKDFDRFTGFEAQMETARPIDGRKRFRGRLLGRKGDVVRLALPEGQASIPVADIRRAKLVLTDELLAAAAAAQQKN